MIFLDTSAIYALADRTDPNNQLAKEDCRLCWMPEKRL